MTGGSDWTKTINEKLAVVARETGLAMVRIYTCSFKKS